MGGIPKASLLLDGATLLEHAVQSLRRGGCTEVAVVLPSGHPSLFGLARRCGAAVVANGTPSDGMFSSVRLGILHFLSENEPITVVVILPVDHPRIRHQTVSALLTFARQSEAVSVRPSYRGRGGHPIVLTAGLARDLLLSPPTCTLRDALRARCAPLCTLPTLDPGVLINVNTPEDLARVVRGWQPGDVS
jgi:molybdenum cofactor cytidylyltransferase